MEEFMRLFLFSSFFISLTAYSCPNLSGTYKQCYNSMNGNEINVFNVKVTQNVVGGVTKYNVKSSEVNDNGQNEESLDEYVANKTPVVTEYDEDYNIETTSWCEDNKLKVSETLLLGEAPVAYAEGEFYKSQNALNMDYQTIDESGETQRHYINCR